MPRWYYVAVVFFVAQGTQAFDIVDRTFYGEWLGKPGDKITQTINLLLIVTSLTLFGRGIRRAKTVRTGAALAVSLAVFLFCSSVWSIDPASSLRYGILYLCVVLGAIGIVTNLKVDEFMELLARVCFVSAVISVIVFLVSPASALSAEGDFRGIFSQKNILGEAMTMGAMASIHGIIASKTARARNAVFLVVLTLVALKSGSATSCLAIFVFCVTAAVAVLILKGGTARMVAISVIVLATPLLLSAAVFQDSMLELIGKDPTLTGRTEIWKYVIPDIYQRPLLGWGYVAFWSLNNPAALEIAAALVWFAPQAHNGLLEILLHVGLIGASFFIFLWARAVWLSLSCMRTVQTAAAISCLLSCVGIMLVGISETVLIVPFEASTSVFFITGLFCEQALRAAGRRGNPTADVATAQTWKDRYQRARAP